MDFQLPFISNWTNSISFLKKRLYHGQDRSPAAAVFDQNSGTLSDCAVCLNDIRSGDSYRKLPECGHCFHSECIDAWFDRSHATCPLCRVEVPQIIPLNENHYQLGALLSDVLLLFHNFVERLCDPPLNDELTPLMFENVRLIS